MWLVLGIILAIIGIVFIIWLSSKTKVSWGKGFARIAYVLAVIPAFIFGAATSEPGQGYNYIGLIIGYIISFIVLKIIFWVFGGFKKK